MVSLILLCDSPSIDEGIDVIVLAAYTPMAFLSSYMTVGVTYTSDRCRDFPIFEHRTEKLNQEIVQLADMVMLEV